MGRLDHKTAIVTGAGSGMGRAYARRFAKEGANVVIVDFNSESGKKVEDEIRGNGGNAVFYQCDVSNEDQVKDVVKNTVDQFGTVDILVNNAQAGTKVTTVEDTDMKTLQTAINTGFLGAFLFSRACLPIMREHQYGRIVNVSSNAGVIGMEGFCSYNASKEAIRSLTRTIANEYGKYGITCNTICPIAYTPMSDQMKKTQPEAYQAIIDELPLRRLGDIDEDIAPAVLFLVSDDAKFVTGQTLGVDGGKTKF